MAQRQEDLDITHLIHKVMEKQGKLKFQEPDKKMKEHTKKYESLYRSYEMTEEEIATMLYRYQYHALQMGISISTHTDVLKQKGWMLPFLLAYDAVFTGRWDYWMEILDKGTIEGSGPIPQIEWTHSHLETHQVRKMLNYCLDGVHMEGASISDFADWLLWGMAATNEPPKINDKVNEHFYRNFDLGIVLKYPTDYLSGLLEQASSQGYKQAVGYFSTPPQVTEAMAMMTIAGQDPQDLKDKSVCDPCVGCGAMLLPMSNYMLFGAGQDINPVALKLCKIQMYWYAPWYAFNPL